MDVLVGFGKSCKDASLYETFCAGEWQRAALFFAFIKTSGCGSGNIPDISMRARRSSSKNEEPKAASSPLNVKASGRTGITEGRRVRTAFAANGESPFVLIY